MFFLERVELRAVYLKVDTRPEVRVGRVKLRAHTRGAPVVALEDRVLEQQPQGRHLRHEHLPRAVHLQRAQEVSGGRAIEATGMGIKRTSSIS